MTIQERRPISERQAQARRENGSKSRGPKSAEGKAKSSQNAVKHGYWARRLRAIDRGPLREDQADLEAFVEAYLAELNPGDSLIRRQAALDVADKAWRLTRAQLWEAEGYAATPTPDVSAGDIDPDWLRVLAGHDRRLAEATRLFPDPSVDGDVKAALFFLSSEVGVPEEDLDWIENGDPAAVLEALTAVIENNFTDREDAASYFDRHASERESHAEALESTRRPDVIRQEVDGSFARNAERIVSHASRELDRSLKRYNDLCDRYGPASDSDHGHASDEHDDQPDPANDQNGQANHPSGTTDALAIWDHITADEAVEFLSRLGVGGRPESPPRNEPTDQEPAM